MRIIKGLKDFMHSDKSGGIILLICTVLSLILTNSSIGESYIGFWHLKVGGMSLEHWINDGLMSIFFLLIGLELEREIYAGELSSKKNAILPFFAALGGMVIPAGIFLLFNFGISTQTGAGIPMATDIAFALAILSLLGSKIPTSLKIFLTALAVIDDLGAIIIISIFYTSSISWTFLGLALLVLVVLVALNRLKITNLIPYLIGGGIMWYFMLNSGVHATITGVILAFVIPFKSIKLKSPSELLLDFLHSPVTFIILPLFALANTAIVIGGNFTQVIGTTVSLGIILGLVIGKPIGIFLFSYLSAQFGVTKLPESLHWKQIFGIGLLGGIGFTMSIFITLLAFEDGNTVNDAKLAILIASFIAGVLGFLFLKLGTKRL